MKASHVDRQLKLLDSRIFNVKAVLLFFIKHLDYKQVRQLKSFLADHLAAAPVFHRRCWIILQLPCSGIVQVLKGDSVVLSSGRKPQWCFRL